MQLYIQPKMMNQGYLRLGKRKKLWTCTNLNGRQLGIEQMSHSNIDSFYKEYRCDIYDIYNQPVSQSAILSYWCSIMSRGNNKAS